MARPALAASRAIDVLNFLAAHTGQAFTLSDLVERLDINLASAHAIMTVLADGGYVVRHPRHRTYTLGPSLVAVGSAALEEHPVIDVARDEARALAAELDLDVVITAQAGTDAVFLARGGAHHPRGFPTHVGQRMPLRPPLGSIYVAWGPANAIEAWLGLAPKTVTGEQLREVLRVVRARGYSVGLDADHRRHLGQAMEERAEHPRSRGSADLSALVEDLGRDPYNVLDVDPASSYDVSSIAAPVFGPRGEVAVALNLVGFTAGMSGRDVAAYGERLRDTGLVLTKRTRGLVPDRAA
jgi:DNA-binding IclR family transcriptional regulator